jgi:hypothetical protein
MTQDEIIEMVREAGLDWHTGWTLDDEEPNRFAILAYLAYDKATEEANARANASWELMCKKMVSLEREACAKVCDGLADMHEKMNQWNSHKTADTLAQAIRARGEQA